MSKENRTKLEVYIHLIAALVTVATLAIKTCERGCGFNFTIASVSEGSTDENQTICSSTS